MPCEQRHQRGERKVEDMLVVDRVELCLVDHFHAVRKLQHHPAIVLE